MAVTTYTVKRGDTLWEICNGSINKNVTASIAGNTIQAKIDTLVRLNNIKNPNLIYVNQVLRLSDGASAGSSGSSGSSNTYNALTITDFGLQSGDTSGRSMFAAWAYSKSGVTFYKTRWSYYQDNHWFIGREQSTSSAESEYCLDTYSAPSGSTKVKLKVYAIKRDEDNNETTLASSSEKEYDFSNNPPAPPPTPNVNLEDNKLTASIENLVNADYYADSVDFNIVKNNSTSIGIFNATVNTISNYVAYIHTVDTGSEYKVRARTKVGNLVSGWSDFSGAVETKPGAVDEITTCKAKNYSSDEITVYLEWDEVKTATTYEIEYTNNKSYFEGSNQTSSIGGIKYTSYEIGGLAVGKEYFFRVRAVNNAGEGEWSEIESIVLGTTPAAPTTWSNTNTAIVGEAMNLYWVHNSEDNSSQTYAELRLYIDGALQSPDITIKNSTEEDEKDRTSVYALDTTEFTEGSKIKWQVRTAGITKVYGDWSIEREIDVYAKPTLELSVTNLPDGTGDIITTLKSFPFYIHALAGPNTQTPIGYHVKITANEFYETIDDMGNTRVVNKDEAIYSKYFDINEPLILEMSTNVLDVEPNIEYKITCTVGMDSGLTAEATHEFTPDWEDATYELYATMEVDSDNLTTSIIPYAEDENGDLAADVVLAVYRREFDGTFVEIMTDVPNDDNTTVIDPHPPLNYARYRIVGKNINTGAISYYDMPSLKVGCTSIIIQWDEEWSEFNATDTYMVEKPAWSGSMLRLPYNVDVQDTRNPDVSLVNYIGRKRPVSYYGTQLGETAAWSTEIPKNDIETLYALRKLSIYQGDCYVREPSGSGYWAHVVVGFGQTHRNLTIPVSLDITRVEGGV